ncbi:MAG: FecR domain-containing protein, partial [bacterium]
MNATRLLSIVGLTVGLVVAASAASHAIPVKASLTTITGDVQVQPPGGGWIPATEGMLVESGAMIKTGAKSSALLRWGAGNTLKLTAFTNFTVNNIDVDPRTKTVNSDMGLMIGKLKGRAEKLQNPSSSFEISTPTAVAGVRGTVFDMENAADNTTAVTTYTGSVDVTAQGQTVNVPAGTQVTVNPGETPGTPTEVTEDDMYSCEVNEDCWSGKCEEGKCVGEEQASQSACFVDGAECADDSSCCSGKCSEGLCVKEEEEEVAAACLKDDEACERDEECCSEDCVDGRCVPKGEEEECLDADEECAMDEECCSGACVEGLCAEAEEIFALITEPSDGDEFPLSAGKITVKGESIPGAVCDVEGVVVTAGDDGTFEADVEISEGELELEATCTDDEGNDAGTSIAVSVVGPPTLIITSPSSGFTSCPFVDLAGITDPEAQLVVNGVLIFDLETAVVYTDGSFQIDNFELGECAQTLVFEAYDEYGQVTKEEVESGAVVDAARVSPVTKVSVNLTTTGQWFGDITTLVAKVTAKSPSPIPYGLVATLESGNPGFLGDALIEPMPGVTSTGEYFGKAEIWFDHPPASPLTVVARVGDVVSSPVSIILERPECKPTAVSVDDGFDNDCDGLVDEEIRDGLDNDFDGRIDEDLMCDFGNPTGDCDRDGIANGEDCNPYEPIVNYSYTDSRCAVHVAAGAIFPDDGIDNDGDFMVDEEYIDGIDNDGDGIADEDTTVACDFADPAGDCDFDGVTNGADCNPYDSTVTILKTDATCAARCDAYASPDGDCDKDGLLNMDEVVIGTNPYSMDTDGDGYLDGNEITEYTDPFNPLDYPGAAYADSDGDGYPDAVEFSYGSNYNDPNSTPVTVGAIAATDSDGDGYPDALEIDYGTDPNNPADYPGAAVSAAGYCYGGMIPDATGACACPIGTVWDAALGACKVQDYLTCATGEYMDYAVGQCVTACTGGQVADSSTRECYCPTGTFMDYTTGKCGTSCPAGFVVSPDGYECVCPDTAPLYDMFKNTCVTQCSGGQVADTVWNSCYCPPGTYEDWMTNTCVVTTSATICPAGTPGSGCDYGVIGDCDADGVLNSQDTEPCFPTGDYKCPPDTPAAGCDLSLPTGDCDADGATNDYDPCPCRFGSSAESFCPPPPTACPAGQFIDYLSGVCVTTCPAGYVGDTVSGECVCAPGTYMDPYTGYCSASCPAGTAPDAYGGCVCSGSTPYFDYVLNSCVATCSGGQVPALDYPECVCPAGTYFDGVTQTCVAMQGCDTAPKADGCICATGADCASGFCSIYDGICMPPSGCNNDLICDPMNEDSLGCADCKCGDYVCDNYEFNTAGCPTDCGTMCEGGCDYSVYGGDCDGDGIANEADTAPCVPDTTVCPAGTAGAGCNQYVAGDCDMDTIDNLYDGCPCTPEDDFTTTATTSPDGCPGVAPPPADCTTLPYADGCTCATGADCASGFCDTTSWVCAPNCVTLPYPDGCCCATGVECASGFCDTTSWVCAPNCVTLPYPDGCGCATGVDCASGFCDTTSWVCAPNCATLPYPDGCG